MVNIPNIPNINQQNIGNTVNKAKAAADKANDVKDKVNNIAKAQKAKFDKAKDEINKKKEALKNITSISTSGIKKKIILLLTPIFLNFVRKNASLKTIVKLLKKQLKKRLKREGILTITGSTFIFIPRDYAKWSKFKSDFDRKLNNIKKLINTLDTIVTQLQNILVILNTSLTALQLLVTAARTKIVAQRVKIAAELASPSPSKPTVAIDLAEIDATLDKLKKIQDKIEEYRLYVTIALQFVSIFKILITKIKFEINQLQLILIDSNTDTSATLDPVITQQPEIDTPETEYISDATYKSYILKLVTYPDGSAQYQALDAFSKMKITQTAPSKIKTTDQLLEEIKQILG